MKWWQIKNLLRKNICGLLFTALICFSAGLYFSYVPTSAPVHIVPKKATMLIPWSKIKQDRLNECLEDQKNIEHECETIQDVKNCQNWIYTIDRCNSWR